MKSGTFLWILIMQSVIAVILALIINLVSEQGTVQTWAAENPSIILAMGGVLVVVDLILLGVRTSHRHFEEPSQHSSSSYRSNGPVSSSGSGKLLTPDSAVVHEAKRQFYHLLGELLKPPVDPVIEHQVSIFPWSDFERDFPRSFIALLQAGSIEEVFELIYKYPYMESAIYQRAAEIAVELCTPVDPRDPGRVRDPYMKRVDWLRRIRSQRQEPPNIRFV
jgi:hypothetical protein